MQCSVSWCLVLCCTVILSPTWLGKRKKFCGIVSGAFVISAAAGRPNFFTYRKISLHA